MTKREELKRVLQAIAEGYFVRGENDRFVVVENPSYTPQDGGDANLMVDLEDPEIAAILYPSGPRSHSMVDLLNRWPIGTWLSVEHDGFAGTVQGCYVTRENKPGLVLQLDNAKVVHVYAERWFVPASLKDLETAGD